MSTEHIVDNGYSGNRSSFANKGNKNNIGNRNSRENIYNESLSSTKKDSKYIERNSNKQKSVSFEKPISWGDELLNEYKKNMRDDNINAIL